MPDRLRKLVNERDKALARPHRLEPQRLVLPARSGESSTQTICLKCRRNPDSAMHRAKWLEANPLQSCRMGGSLCIPEHQHWTCCVTVHVTANMPPMTMCPECGGQLVEITA